METGIIIILGFLLGRSLFCNKKLHDDRRKYNGYNPSRFSERTSPMTQKECDYMVNSTKYI